MLTPVVIDASVALKWYLKKNEEFAEEALQVLSNIVFQSIPALVPAHFYVEVGSTMYRKKPEIARKALQELLELNFIMIEMDRQLINRCDDLLKKYPRLVFYDIVYHAIAQTENAVLITADKEYYEQTKEEGSIILLKDFPSDPSTPAA